VSLILVEGVALFAAVATTVFFWGQPLLLDWLDVANLLGQAAVFSLCCIVAFYYNDLYNFEVPHDVGQLFRRLCRALGLSALVLAGGYLLFPGMILGGNLASYALLLTLIWAVLIFRVLSSRT